MFTDRRIVMLLLAAATLAAGPKSERTDLYGEPLPPGAIARLGRGEFPRLVPAGTFAFAPDGKTMATVSADDTLRLEKPPASLDLLRLFRGPHSPSNSIGVSLDGRSVHCGGIGFDEKDGNWLLTTAIQRKHPRFFGGEEKWLLQSVAISADRNWLAAACPDGTLRIWAAEHPETLREIHKQKCPTPAVVFSPDGKQVATAGKDGTIRLWDAADGKEIRRLQGLHESAIALAYSLDGKVLAAAWKEGAIRSWNPSDGKEIGRFQFDRDRSPVYAVAVSPEGKWVTAAGRRGIQRWNIATHKEMEYGGLFELTHMIFALAFSPSSKHLAMASIDGAILARGLGPDTGGVLNPTLNKEVLSVVFSPDSNTVATAGVDGLRLWETRTWRETRRLIWNQDPWVRAVAFSPDGGLLASGDDVGLVQVWEVAGGREKRRFEGLQRWIMTIGFLDRGILAAGDSSGTARLWDIAQGRELRSLGKSDRFVQTFASSPNKKSLASANLNDGVVRLWDAATGRERFNFQGNVGGVHAVAFAPAGEVLATTGGKDNTIRLWDAATGRERNRFPAAEHYAQNKVAFSPDGKVLAFMGKEAVQLLESATGRERIRFSGHEDAVNDFAFSADGRMLASASRDSTALIWDVTGRCPDRRWHTQDLTAEQVRSYWRTLAGEDAAAAHRAIWTLTAAPEQTMPFLQKHLRPAPSKNIKRLPALLANLDSNQFAVREAATHELEEMGEAAEPALRKVLAGKPSLEVRRRVEPIVKKLDNWPVSAPAALRDWRALEVLEHLGTPEARQLLQQLADGAPEARLTHAAKAALNRLAARRDTMP